MLDGDWWVGLTYGEKLCYAGGVIGGTYAFAVKYMGDHPGLGGTSLFEYAILYVNTERLVAIADAVYADMKLRIVPVAAVIFNWRYWEEYLRSANG